MQRTGPQATRVRGELEIHPLCIPSPGPVTKRKASPVSRHSKPPEALLGMMLNPSGCQSRPPARLSRTREGTEKGPYPHRPGPRGPTATSRATSCELCRSGCVPPLPPAPWHISTGSAWVKLLEATFFIGTASRLGLATSRAFLNNIYISLATLLAEPQMTATGANPQDKHSLPGFVSARSM